MRSTNKNNETVSIGSNTQIVFTTKSFLLTIGTILGIFFGFYQLVVIPKIESYSGYNEKMFEYQKEQNKVFYDEFSKINTSVNDLNLKVDRLTTKMSEVHTSIKLGNKIDKNKMGNTESKTINLGSVDCDSTLADK